MKPIRPLFRETVPSTNSLLKELARDGAPEGTLLIADRQSDGYGRLGRSFFSPQKAGLYMSLLLRPSFSPEKASLLTLAAAVATAEAIEAVSGVSATIKWVNDVYTSGKKTAGILTETALAPDGSLSYVIVGIGVNLFAPEGGFPRGLCAAALFPERRRAELVSLRAALYESFCARFGALYDRLPQNGFLEEYRRRCFLLGEDVLIYDAITDSEKKGSGTPARALGITEDGLLLVRFESGEERTLLAGDVTLKPADAF